MISIHNWTQLVPFWNSAKSFVSSILSIVRHHSLETNIFYDEKISSKTFEWRKVIAIKGSFIPSQFIFSWAGLCSSGFQEEEEVVVATASVRGQE